MATDERSTLFLAPKAYPEFHVQETFHEELPREFSVCFECRRSDLHREGPNSQLSQFRPSRNHSQSRVLPACVRVTSSRWRRQSFDGHRLTITETIYRVKLRVYGKKKGSLTTVGLPEELANQIGAWLETLKDKGPAAFLFPNAGGGFILKDNYLHRVLYPLRKQLGLPKLNFQILRRTFSTRGLSGCLTNT